MVISKHSILILVEIFPVIRLKFNYFFHPKGKKNWGVTPKGSDALGSRFKWTYLAHKLRQAGGHSLFAMRTWRKIEPFEGREWRHILGGKVLTWFEDHILSLQNYWLHSPLQVWVKWTFYAVFCLSFMSIMGPNAGAEKKDAHFAGSESYLGFLQWNSSSIQRLQTWRSSYNSNLQRSGCIGRILRVLGNILWKIVGRFGWEAFFLLNKNKVALFFFKYKGWQRILLLK